MGFSLRAALFTAIDLLVVCKCKSTPEKKRSPQPPPPPRKPKVRHRTVPDKNPDLSSVVTDDRALFDPVLDRVSMVDLLQATKNFSSDLIVGDGSFGFVYKAKLYSGLTVALKRLSQETFQGLRQFRAEIEALRKIRHPNIVQILGYCSTGSERVLVLEYFENRSLDHWLHNTSTENDHCQGVLDERMTLSWKTRVKIIKGIAKGLAHLHNLVEPIIHRDIKAGNILLDKDFEAHIADFGLARCICGSKTHVTTQVAGTMGYVPPEYGIMEPGCATMRGDVYSFGILAFEIITGRQPYRPFPKKGEEARLINWIDKMIEQKRCIEMVDANISKEELKENTVIELIRIAIMCTRKKASTRPRMNEVVELLNKIRS